MMAMKRPSPWSSAILYCNNPDHDSDHDYSDHDDSDHDDSDHAQDNDFESFDDGACDE